MKLKAILFLILLLALALRLNNLFDKEFGTDEDISLADARLIKDSKPLEYLYTPLPSEVNPPLYFHVLALALAINDSISAAKILMVILGMLTLIVFFMLAKRLFNEKIALFATLLLAINPMHLIYSQHIRTYGLVFLLYTISLYFLHKFLFEKDSKSLIYLAITYIIAAYTHYHTMLFMAGSGITVLLFYCLNRETKLKQYIICAFIIILAVIPALLLLYQQYTLFSLLGGNEVWPELTPELVPYPFWKYSVMADVSTVLENFPLIAILFPLLIGVSAYGAYLLYKNSKERFVFLAANIAVPFIIFITAGSIWRIFSFRYITYLLIPYVLLYSYGLFKIKNKMLRVLLILTLVAGWAYVIYYYYNISQFYLWAEHIAV